MNNNFSLEGKNIIITGASSGIGRQCAIQCSELGARVIIIGRNKEKLSKTYSSLSGTNHMQILADITNYDLTESTIQKIVTTTGGIDGFLHSAGMEISYPLNILKATHYENIFSINVIAGFEWAKYLSRPKNLSHKGGSFVFISSIMGVVGNSSLIAYSASKGAVISGVKSMAIELAKKNIRVNAISPGYIEDTEMTVRSFSILSPEQIEQIKNQHPLGFGKCSDVANACVFLLSDASRWITGSNLITDGGYSTK